MISVYRGLYTQYIVWAGLGIHVRRSPWPIRIGLSLFPSLYQVQTLWWAFLHSHWIQGCIHSMHTCYALRNFPPFHWISAVCTQFLGCGKESHVFLLIYFFFQLKLKEPKLVLGWKMTQEEQSSARWSQGLAVLLTVWSMREAGELGE